MSRQCPPLLMSFLFFCLFSFAVAARAAAIEPAAGPSSNPPVAHSLERADLEPWLDGFMPYAIERGDVAGAVVAVVKNGEVIFAKGYGLADVEKHKPVDAERTMFRPGSISKLFTWTAVMQLVEQGKLDLHKDVNEYLYFKIPPRSDGPVTLRNTITHPPPFHAQLNSLIASN